MPGTSISIVEQAANRTIPTDTGVAFFVGAGGTAASGIVFPVQLVNMEQFETIVGPRATGNQTLYDACETFFREGGSTVYVAATTVATPADADYLAALALFRRELGPGQVAAPGISTVAVQSALLAHAAANRRVALIDVPSASNQAAAQAAHDALNADANARFGAVFGNWLVIPGITPGTTRHVPPSASVAGLIARSDRRGNPNLAAAGNNGVSNIAIGLVTEFTTTAADALNDGSVNVFRVIFGNIELYGFRTLVTKATDQNWWQFTTARLYMAIATRSDIPLESTVFAQLDGQRRRLAQLEGEVAGVLLGFYNDGALYGTTPVEAFTVDATSPSVNPDLQLADGIVRVRVAVRMSPFAEMVQMELSKVAISEALPA